MKKYNFITLRPTNKSDIPDYDEFRRPDIVHLHILFSASIFGIAILSLVRYFKT